MYCNNLPFTVHVHPTHYFFRIPVVIWTDSEKLTWGAVLSSSEETGLETSTTFRSVLRDRSVLPLLDDGSGFMNVPFVPTRVRSVLLLRLVLVLRGVTTLANEDTVGSINDGTGACATTAATSRVAKEGDCPVVGASGLLFLEGTIFSTQSRSSINLT